MGDLCVLHTGVYFAVQWLRFQWNRGQLHNIVFFELKSIPLRWGTNAITEEVLVLMCVHKCACAVGWIWGVACLLGLPVMSCISQAPFTTVLFHPLFLLSHLMAQFTDTALWYVTTLMKHVSVMLDWVSFLSSALKKAAVGPKSVGWNITGEGRELALKSQAEFKVYTLWLMLSQSLSMLLSTLAWTVLIWQIMLTLTLCQQNTLILYYGSGSAYIQNCHGPFWFFLFFTKPKISQ